MASKRTFDEKDHQGNHDRDLQGHGKRRHGDPQQDEAMQLASMIAPYLEPVVRNMMDEIIPSILQRHGSPCCRSCLNQKGGTCTSEGRAMQLCFVNGLPPKIFTQANITAEDGGPLQIELRYAASQQRVVTGQVSNMKTKICVLEADFGSNDGKEDWTAEEFEAQIRKPREGRGPLLKGDTVIKLEKGIASITNKIVFTDNSCGTRSRMYRLGVQIAPSNSVGNQTDIREGRTGPFKVMDKRGEAYKKPDRPSLNDEVWRLKSIAKGGEPEKQLSSNGIKTVKDLLRLNTTGLLREKFGNIKALDKIIEHAKDCEIDDDERYIYHATSLSLVFNCVYEVVEVIFNVQQQHCRRSLQSLNLEEKRLVERVKQEAYKNMKDLVPLPIETTTHAPDRSLHHPFLIPHPHQGQLETCSSTSTSIFYQTTENDLLDYDQLFALQGKMPLNLCAGVQVVPEEAYIDEGNGWGDPSVSHITQLGSYFINNQFGSYHNPCSFSNDNGASCSNIGVCISSKGKSKTFWQKIRHALKWVIPHVAGRRAQLFPPPY